MKAKTYASPAAFKRALEDRLKSASASADSGHADRPFDEQPPHPSEITE